MLPLHDGHIGVDASGFNKNFNTADDTLPKVLTKLDQMSTGSAGGGTAASTTVVVTSFNKNLSSADTNVQHALNTIDQLTFATGSSLPSQSGSAGKYLYTDGNNASWQAVTGSSGSGSVGGVPEEVFYGSLGNGGNASYTDYAGNITPGDELFYGTLGAGAGSNGVDYTATLGSGSVYSYSENAVGVWVDGKIMYRKVVDFGSLPNATTKSVSSGISNINEFVKISGVTLGADGNQLVLPRAYSGSLIELRASKTTGNITVITQDDQSSHTLKVITEYTCTDR